MGQGFIKKNGGSLEVKGKYEQLVNYTMLYDYGDECTDITGGWEYTTTQYDGISKYQDLQSKVFQKNADHIYMYGTGTGYCNARGGAVTANKINLSSYNMVFVKSAITASGKQTYFQIETSSSKTYMYSGGIIAEGIYNTNASGVFVKNLPNALFSFGVADSVYLHLHISSGGYNGAIGVKMYNVTLFKSDNWYELASKAGVTASSISALLAKSSTILINEDAVEFMIYQCTGDFMAAAIADSTFLAALASSPYKELVYANEHWAKFLAMVA